MRAAPTNLAADVRRRICVLRINAETQRSQKAAENKEIESASQRFGVSLRPLRFSAFFACLRFTRLFTSAATVVICLLAGVASADDPPVNTFSIVAFDPATGDLGIAVASKVLGVGCVVPWAKANVGAVATQSAANTAFGPDGLKLLETGKTAKATLAQLIEGDSRSSHRQVGIVDAKGNVASFTGTNCQAWAGHFEGQHFAVQGNILTDEGVIKAMAAAYEQARKADGTELADWLMAALKAGEDAGGDKRGKQSAALMVVREKGGYGGNDRYIDLRVDDHTQPVVELARLLEVHKQFFPGGHKKKPKRDAK
jgi:uncharacterized Ntn-hydrolase superfamily protein